MNVTFLNGAEKQHEVVQAAIRSLLHLDLDRFDFDVDVEFVDNPEPSIHNEFAYTDTEVEPTLIQFRTDFPHFAPTAIWGDIGFATESVIHEVAHALLGQLSTEVFESILALFGSTMDELLADNDRPWVDRIREGIAETFKDAFLPVRMRAFANRTNVKLPINQYPAFRAIWRAAMEGGGEPETIDYASWNVYVYPHYDPIDPPGVYRWIDYSTYPPDGVAFPDTQPDESLAPIPDGWSNPMEFPAGQEDWTITLPWEYEGLIDRPGPFGMLGIPEGGFGWQLVTSSLDNVQPPFGLARQLPDVQEPYPFDPLSDWVDPPREGWVTWWLIWWMAWANVTGLQTSWSVHVHGFYAPDGDMHETWPDTDYFPGYPKVYHTYLPDMGGFDPGWTGPDPAGYGDAEEYIYVPWPDVGFPGTLELPVKTPPLPAYLGMDWNYSDGFYDYPNTEIRFPYGMTAEIGGGLDVPADAPVPAASVEQGGQRGGSVRVDRRVDGGLIRAAN